MQRDTDATDESNHPTRRSVLGSSAFASLGVALGLPSRARGTSQNRTDSESVQGSEHTGRIYASDFYPDALFRVVSKPLEYKPDVPVQEGEAFLADLYWNQYGTRIVRYENTGERVLFFPPLDAPIERDGRYRTRGIRSTDQLAEGIVSVGFGPVEGSDESDE